MDRNSVIGLSLIFVILIGYFFLTRSNYEEIEAAKRKQDSAMMVVQKAHADSARKFDSINKATTALADSADSTQVIAPSGPFAKFTQGTDELITIENDVLKVQISTRGGHPYSAELKNYQRAPHEGETGKQPLILFQGGESKFNIRFITNDGFTDSTSRLYFTPSAKNVVADKDSGIVSLKAAFSDNQYLEQVYWLKPGSYELYYTVRMKGLDKVLSPSQRFIQLDWQLAMRQQESNIENERKASTVYFRGADGEVDNITETAFEAEKPAGSVQWVAFKQQFFNSTLIALNQEGLTGVTVETQPAGDATHVKVTKASSILNLKMTQEETIPMKFYLGPNKYEELKKVGMDMDELVKLGWGIFGWINRYIILPIFKYLGKITTNYGIIILIMTLIIKAALFGLVYKSYISSAKMRILKPEIDELKAKYGNDLQKIQQEQMSLFRRAGVSPLGGCLPMLLQMPFLIAMFQFFPASIELRQQSFLWASDLSTYDSIWTFGYVPVINFIYGDHVSLFTLLMTISTLIYTLFNNQLTGVSGQMKYIGYIMPIFFLGFFNNYAAGLTYYYFLTNVISIGQQFIIRRFVDEDALHRKIQENKKKPVKKSRFQQRLEDMAKARGVDPKKLKK